MKIEKMKFNNGEKFNIVEVKENISIQPQTLLIKILLEDGIPSNSEYFENLFENIENTCKIQVLDSEDNEMAVFYNYSNLASLKKNYNDYTDANESEEIKYNTLSLFLAKSSLEEKVDILNKSLEETNKVVDSLVVNSLEG